MGNVQSAESIYRDLLKRNPENWGYYEKLEECLKPETEKDRMDIYMHYRRIYPRVEAPKRLLLNFVSGETFEKFVDEYLRNALRKGVPPLFVNLRGLYKDPVKVNAFEKIILAYIQNLEKYNKFSESDQCTEDPTVLLWTYFFASQHYDQLRKTDVALEYIDKVLEHTPTLIEGYMVKARIYKHAGCSGKAVRWMDEGRSLDTADRYVNSKCAKYLLRNNQIKKSEEICGLFTREGIPAAENLDEMQCMWFLTECARSHQRLGNIGEALKKCHQIDRIFSEIIEDQFDFHTYCMRKVTLTAYLRLLKLEDILRSHPFYFKAAKVALECYIRLYDKPYQEGDKDDELNKGNLSAQELKKLKSKQRRAKKKAAQQEEKKANESKENKETEKKEEKKERFDATALVKTEKPLEDAMKFLVPLQLLAKERLETHLYAFEIYFRKGKPLLMLQSIKRAIKIDPENNKLHECIIRFVKKANDSRENYSQVVISVLDKEMPSFVTHTDLPTYNMEYLKKHRDSFACRISVAKMIYHLDPSKKDEAMQMLTDISADCLLEDCTTVFNLLNDGSIGDCKNEVEAYKKACHNRFPYADVFQSENPNDGKLNDANDAHINMNGETPLCDGVIDGTADDGMYP